MKPSPMPTPLPQITTLARSGALDRAWGLFCEGGYLSASGDAAALAVKGRLLKDRALISHGGERAILMADAIAAYAAADAIDPQPWLLLNVATLSLLAGDDDAAQRLADAVLTRIAPGQAVNETPYFLAATCAEALLLKHDIGGADAALGEARAADPDGWSDHATTLRHFRLIIAAQGGSLDWLDRHRPPRSAHFAGHLGVDPHDCADLRAEIDTILDQQNIGFGYGALAAGADIVIAESLIARGGELHVVLPAEEPEFFRVSVSPFPGWDERYRACLAAAATLTIATQTRGAFEPLATALAAERAMGAAALNARLLESEAVQILVIDDGDGPWGGGKHTARDGEVWRRALKEQRIVVAPRRAAVPPSASRNEGRTDLGLAALLHVRFDGVDGLGDADFAEAVDAIIAPIRRAMMAIPNGPVRDMPCGNARLMQFEDVAAAALFARALHALDPPDGWGKTPLTLVAHYGLVHRIGDMIAGPAIAGLSTFLPATPGGTLTLSAAFAHAYAIVAGPEVRMPVVGDAGGEPIHALCVMG
jgi:hypothetical protein